MEIDRTLLRQLVEFAVNTRDAGASELEKLGAPIMRMYEGVRLLRAKFDTTVTNMGAASVGIWQSIARVQQEEQLILSLNNKLDALQQVHSLRTAVLASTRARRLNQTVMVFTAVSVVASLAAVIEFAVNEKLSAPNVLRTLLIVVVALSCGAVVIVASQESRRRG